MTAQETPPNSSESESAATATDTTVTETETTTPMLREPTLDLGDIKNFLDLEEWEDGVKNTDVDWLLSSLALDMNAVTNQTRSTGTSDPLLSDMFRSAMGSAPPVASSASSATSSATSNSTPKPISRETPVVAAAASSARKPVSVKSVPPTNTAAFTNDLEVTTSPHISTPISNTNRNNLSKTKPSTTLSNDVFLPSGGDSGLFHPPVTGNTGAPRRKGSVLSVASASSATSQGSIASGASQGSSGGGGGFFSKLKGKLMKNQEDPHTTTAALNAASNAKSRTYSETSRPHSLSISSVDSASNKAPLSGATSGPSMFKSNYTLNGNASAKTADDNGTVPLTRSRTTGGLRFSSTGLTDTVNPYGSTGASTGGASSGIPFYKDTLSGMPASSTRAARSRSFSSDSGVDITDPRLVEYIKFFQVPCEKQRRSSMKRGSVQRARASVGGGKSTSLPVQLSTSPPETKFSFLRRKSTITSESSSPPTSDRSSMSHIREESPDLVEDAASQLPEFKEIRPLKRVAFHLSTFLIDPPQQIPSRTPRKGNVDVLANGTVKINPLTDSDKIAIEKLLMGQGGGIVIGGTGALGYLKKDENEAPSSSSSKETLVGPDDEAIDTRALTLGIEKPIAAKAYSYKAPVKKMALDLMYTRCCHLREILPIPGILKQIPKGSMAPLRMLQLRNPTPTMVEIQTFADFIRIAPIVCVSLDGVNLSLEQFKILLSAMAAKTQLEKISLRNTPIDEEGWRLLCWFLSRNRILTRLDITQCPILAVNVIKKKKKKKPSLSNDADELTRMICNKENRSDMDWSLFTATIVARGGINELILTGCCITDQELFENLIRYAVSIKTDRLGLAYNNLTPRQTKVVFTDWMMKPLSTGIDLGYNDLSSMAHLKVFTDMLKSEPNISKTLFESKILFISLNCTNLRFNDEFKYIFENMLMKLERLKYLDLSNNAKLFATGTKDEEAVCQFFTDRLPLFPKLKRLHLENLNLSLDSLLSLSNIIPFCTNLGYLSLLGNKIDLGTATALIQALKNSQSLVTLDLDYDEYPHIFKERIGLYTMRNMERLLRTTHKPSTGKDVPLDESESLTYQLNHLLTLKAEHKLDLQSDEVKAFMHKCNSVRANLTESINELLQIQLNNQLNLEGKETLVRFLFINSTIAKGMQLIDPSLVDKDSNSFDLNLFEDEKDRRLKEQQEKFDNEISNDLLVPRPQPTIIEDEATSMKKILSRNNVNDLTRQEASVLKLSKFKDADIIDSIQDVSGEDLKRTLYDINITDLDTIVKNLKMMKDKGISITSVFSKSDGDALDLEQIRVRLEQLAQDSFTSIENSELDKLHPDVRGSGTMHGENGVKEDGTSNGELPKDHTDHDSDADAIRLSLRRMLQRSIKSHAQQDGKVINDAYDALLETFAKFSKGIPGRCHGGHSNHTINSNNNNNNNKDTTTTTNNHGDDKTSDPDSK